MSTLAYILQGATTVFMLVAIVIVLVKTKSTSKISKFKVPGTELEFSHGMDVETQNVFKTMWMRFDTLQDTLKESKEQYRVLAIQNKQDLASQNELINAIINKIEGIFIDHLKMMFYSPNLDDEERLCAGLKYIEAEHNHTMRKDVIKFGIMHPALYRALTLAKQNWKVKEIELGILEAEDAG